MKRGRSEVPTPQRPPRAASAASRRPATGHIAHRGRREVGECRHQHPGGKLRAGVRRVVAIGAVQRERGVGGERASPGLGDGRDAGPRALGNAAVQSPDALGLVDPLARPLGVEQGHRALEPCASHEFLGGSGRVVDLARSAVFLRLQHHRLPAPCRQHFKRPGVLQVFIEKGAGRSHGHQHAAAGQRGFQQRLELRRQASTHGVAVADHQHRHVGRNGGDLLRRRRTAAAAIAAGAEHHRQSQHNGQAPRNAETAPEAERAGRPEAAEFRWCHDDEHALAARRPQAAAAAAGSKADPITIQSRSGGLPAPQPGFDAQVLGGTTCCTGTWGSESGHNLPGGLFVSGLAQPFDEPG